MSCCTAHAWHGFLPSERTHACVLQNEPQAAINGTVFYNVTLIVQKSTSQYLSLVNGATYFVSVRATGAGAQGLTTVVSSSGVEVQAA